MDIKVEVQTEYERFTVRIPGVPDDIKPEVLAFQMVTHILSAVDSAKVVFEGADDREGQLVFIHGGSKSVKHIAILPDEKAPAVEAPSPEYARQEGPVYFHAAVTFLGQPMTIDGICYVYPVRAGLFRSIYLPQQLDKVPASTRADERTLMSIVANWRVERGDKLEDFTVLVPPGELSPQQAIEYCKDYIKLLKAETPHVAEETTAKAWYGHARRSIAEE